MLTALTWILAVLVGLTGLGLFLRLTVLPNCDDWEERGRHAARSGWLDLGAPRGDGSWPEGAGVFSPSEVAELTGRFNTIYLTHQQRELSVIRRTLNHLARRRIPLVRSHVINAAQGHIVLFFNDGTLIEAAGVPPAAQHWLSGKRSIRTLGMRRQQRMLEFIAGTARAPVPATAVRVGHVTQPR